MLVCFRLLCWSHVTGLGAVFILTTLSGFLLIWGLHGKVLAILVYVERSWGVCSLLSLSLFLFVLSSIQRNQVCVSYLDSNGGWTGCMEYAKIIPWLLWLESWGCLYTEPVGTTQCSMIMTYKGIPPTRMSTHLYSSSTQFSSALSLLSLFSRMCRIAIGCNSKSVRIGRFVRYTGR